MSSALCAGALVKVFRSLSKLTHITTFVKTKIYLTKDSHTAFLNSHTVFLIQILKCLDMFNVHVCTYHSIFQMICYEVFLAAIINTFDITLPWHCFKFFPMNTYM